MRVTRQVLPKVESNIRTSCCNNNNGKAKPKMTDLYSINALSMMLERDRGTLTRALKDVPPDGHEHGQPRWKVSTAAAALERRSYRPQSQVIGNTGRSIDDFHFRRPTRLDALRSDYDQKLLAITEEKSPKRKRELALTLAPRLERYQTVFREVARAINACDDIAIEARSELIFSEMMDEVSKAADWPRHHVGLYRDADNDFGLAMMRAMNPDDADDADASSAEDDVDE